ncbi:hypothetical protein RHMOL_Rhmol09G0177400 [Rhododendron molle]|uniref:Uncharacterized protein n=1 Tax=Rhododendron molle TaxID=49168 RepID=A0ACC0MGC7_RHOML|nr:hypothetical protein RHMOL_Rhmol09G0177400 [Rhododendron molle]
MYVFSCPVLVVSKCFSVFRGVDSQRSALERELNELNDMLKKLMETGREMGSEEWFIYRVEEVKKNFVESSIEKWTRFFRRRLEESK